MNNIQGLNKYRWKGYSRPRIKCAVCGVEFETSPSCIKRNKQYCCYDCYNQARKGKTAGEKHYNWQGGKITKICITCNREFRVKREQEIRTGAKFCSLNCRSIYNVRYNHGSQNTDIEKITENILTKLGVEHQKQVPIDGVALVDFLIDNNKIIQCDGDYWHSLPLTKERDNKQDAYLCQHGYRILRLKGSEIKKRKVFCIDKIKTFLTVENKADNVGQKGNQ